MSSLNVAARQGATPDASAGAERRTTEGRSTPQGRRALLKARDALGMIVLFVLDPRQSLNNVLELSLNRSGYDRIKSCKKGSICANDCGDSLPELNVIHLVSSTG
jgi:hypothetical protein